MSLDARTKWILSRVADAFDLDLETVSNHAKLRGFLAEMPKFWPDGGPKAMFWFNPSPEKPTKAEALIQMSL
ncbi:hypothetical protein ADUPG1_000170, partial [Aduncisulcus paluster]